MTFPTFWYVTVYDHSSARPKKQYAGATNGEASDSKSKFTTIDDVLKGLVDWLCAQVRALSQITFCIACLFLLILKSENHLGAYLHS